MPDDEEQPMTAIPLPPTHLLTVGEYLSLGEDEYGRSELQEGSLVMSPSPIPNHNVAAYRLAAALDQQLPDRLEPILDIDVDLLLAPPDGPGTCRRPDVAVMHKAARPRVHAEGGSLRASDVVLAVEVTSPGSRRTDNMIKRLEYADAGIPHYWIVDLDDPVTLLACRRHDELGYVESQHATHTFTATEPFAVTIDLDQLY